MIGALGQTCNDNGYDQLPIYIIQMFLQGFQKSNHKATFSEIISWGIYLVYDMLGVF